MSHSILSLVGAGPGDPDLITLKAIKRLQQADVVLYDALASASLLQYTTKNCKTFYVGKRCGRHTYSQADIGQLIEDLASTHTRIVRLKGGDPGVFGRTQEEMEVARRCHMTLEIIPGISSAMGIAAAGRFPLTARGYSESLWIGTGTTRTGQPSKDLLIAARSSATLVILMAGRRLETIQQILIDAGKGDTPAAVIASGTTADQQTIAGKAGNIAALAKEQPLKGPVTLIVGQVLRLHYCEWPVEIQMESSSITTHPAVAPG